MNIIEKLKPLVNGGIIPHAVLLEGSGRLDAAEYLANAAVCTGNVKPCGNCNGCLKAVHKAHPDIIYYSPKGNSKTYPVDLIRDIRKDAFILPNEANKKMYILQDVDNMSAQSQDALLKILEEPPEHACFVLTCSEKASLLETIISRMLVFSSTDVQNEQSSEEAHEYAQKIARSIVSTDELELLQLTYELSLKKEIFDTVLSELINIFRNVYLIKCGKDNEDVDAKFLSKSLTLQNALDLIDGVIKIRNAVSRNANANLNMTRFSALLKDAACK